MEEPTYENILNQEKAQSLYANTHIEQQEPIYSDVFSSTHRLPQRNDKSEVIYCEVEFSKGTPTRLRTPVTVEKDAEIVYATVVHPQSNIHK